MSDHSNRTGRQQALKRGIRSTLREAGVPGAQARIHTAVALKEHARLRRRFGPDLKASFVVMESPSGWTSAWAFDSDGLNSSLRDVAETVEAESAARVFG
jgi:hypothetical protein